MREPSAPARQKLLFEVTRGYSAIVDGPGCFFISDWVEMYPNAKFVLGLRRSPTVWLDSVNRSMGKVFGRGVMYWLAWFVPELYFGFSMNNLWEAQMRERYGIGVRTEEYYRAHNDYVRSVVPKERLLEFQAGDGWEPLARFLGREVPGGPFPHRNDARAANGLIRRFVLYGMGVWVVVLVCGWVVVRGVIIYMDI
jgi:hypothetical protein